MRKLTFILLLLCMGVVMAQEACIPPTEWNKTYTYPWLAPCYIEVRDSAYFAGNSVMIGDLTVGGTITGTITGLASDVDTTGTKISAALNDRLSTHDKADSAVYSDSSGVSVTAYDVDTTGTDINAALNDRLSTHDKADSTLLSDSSTVAVTSYDVDTTGTDINAALNARLPTHGKADSAVYADTASYLLGAVNLVTDTILAYYGDDSSYIYHNFGTFHIKSDGTLALNGSQVTLPSAYFLSDSIWFTKNTKVMIQAGGSGSFYGPLVGNADTASDVDTTGTDIAAALGDRQPLCTALTQWCAIIDSVTSGAADSIVIGWTVGKPDTLIDVR